MKRSLLFPMLLIIPFALSAQTPQTRLTYEDRFGTTGHTIVVDGKSFGPYKEVESITYSTSGVSGIFLVTKRDKTYIVAQGKEFGPLSDGFSADQSFISDDGKVAAVLASQYNEEDDTSQTQLWANGKFYGPFEEVYPFDYAETSGNWIASARHGEEDYEVLMNGKSLGTYYYVDMVWMSPDGKTWGYSVQDEEGTQSIYTQNKTYQNVSSANFNQMYPRSAHWGYSVREDGEEEELIVIDGKEYHGYLNFYSMTVTESGKNWGFTAEKMAASGDIPVVIINGKEYIGESLETTAVGGQEYFLWTVKDGSKVTVQVLALP